jgi:hypothetical protein
MNLLYTPIPPYGYTPASQQGASEGLAGAKPDGHFAQLRGHWTSLEPGDAHFLERRKDDFDQHSP